MTATAEQVLEAACALNEDDRALVIDALIATLSTKNTLSDEQRAAITAFEDFGDTQGDSK